MSQITREMFDKFVASLEEERERAFHEPDTILCLGLPMTAIRQLAKSGARLIMNRDQWNELNANRPNALI